MPDKIKITNSEIRDLLGVRSGEFPKYSTQVINLANQIAQATRPRVVGQMSELIQEFSGKTIDEWERWYLERHPEAIKNATEKIVEMIENFRAVMDLIDEQLVENWVRDLVIVKTFIGLKFQEAILKRVAREFDTDYRLANPEEEARGIDGYIGGLPVSIKPLSYQSKPELRETIDYRIIYYEKQKDGIVIDLRELL